MQMLNAAVHGTWLNTHTPEHCALVTLVNVQLMMLGWAQAVMLKPLVMPQSLHCDAGTGRESLHAADRQNDLNECPPTVWSSSPPFQVVSWASTCTVASMHRKVAQKHNFIQLFILRPSCILAMWNTVNLAAGVRPQPSRFGPVEMEPRDCFRTPKTPIFSANPTAKMAF
jgi:hypothetical protein